MISGLTKKQIGKYGVVALLLVGAGWQANGWYHAKHEKCARRVRAGGYRYISPLLDVELPDGVNMQEEPIAFKSKVEEFVKRQIDNGKVTEMSVYFRDLFDGPWFGINQDARFDAASMMKVPIMVAWLKRAETDKSIFNREFLFDGKEDMTRMQMVKPKQTLVAGRTYTLNELLHYMINYSDNNATKLLYTGLTTKELDDVLDGMDVQNDAGGGYDAITVHGYSGFFRILFNAAYLNREMSEKALALLTLEDFPQGMAAGVPKDVPVAAKFGERGTLSDNERQLHEFGIVYHRNGPYILGIMTRGHDMEGQAEIIRNLSALVYSEVSGVAQTEKTQ